MKMTPLVLAALLLTGCSDSAGGEVAEIDVPLSPVVTTPAVPTLSTGERLACTRFATAYDSANQALMETVGEGAAPLSGFERDGRLGLQVRQLRAAADGAPVGALGDEMAAAAGAYEDLARLVMQEADSVQVQYDLFVESGENVTTACDGN